MTAKMTAYCLFLAFGMAILTGCNPEGDRSQKNTKAQPLANNFTSLGVDDSKVKTETPKAQNTSAGRCSNAGADPAAIPQTIAPGEEEQPLGTTRKVAEKGVGAKGRDYGRGVIATPAASLFAVKERMVFDALIPQAMQLFKANEDRAPKSHEEFMERIIKENRIQLPVLPDGDRYVYDPKTEQLMVESPVKE